MALENTILTPDGDGLTIQVYNGHPIIDYPITFTYEDMGEAYAFNGFSSAFFRIFDGRGPKKVKNFTSQVSRNAGNLVINCSSSDMTFSITGKYYYEIGYVRSGGYEIVLQYGELIVI